jgi:hypothetical protein
MKQVMLLLLGVVSGATAIPKAYDVVPFKNYIGVQTLGQVGVAQYYRNTLDSLTFVWFWVGDTFTSDRFRVEIRDSVTDDQVAQTVHVGSHASRCWTWLPCTLVTTNGRRPVRGRTYKTI